MPVEIQPHSISRRPHYVTINFIWKKEFKTFWKIGNYYHIHDKQHYHRGSMSYQEKPLIPKAE